MLTISDKGLLFIASFEGFRSRPYNDAAGHATIGYGHLMHYGPVTAKDRARYPLGISRAAALKLLRSDAAKAEASVREYVTRRPFKQREFDALCSFTFNCGGGALAHSTLLLDVNRHRDAAIRADFCRWSHAGGVTLAGLLRRRNAEADMFLHGTYSTL
jgi:GH24 family phage-related lysozyme (muramidase)